MRTKQFLKFLKACGAEIIKNRGNGGHYLVKMTEGAKKAETVDAGTGDVFQDLKFADAGVRKLRVQLAMRLNDLIQERKLTQTAAARITPGSSQHKNT